MTEDGFEPEQLHDEAWWERELHRSEKLMDKYMAVLGDEPDWDKWKNPEDLYNKVHFDIDPPERPASATAEEAAELLDAILAEEESTEELENLPCGDELVEAMEAVSDLEENLEDEEMDDPDELTTDHADYPEVSREAREFVVRVLQSEEMPEDAQVLRLSAGKVCANLAGGHALGYEDDSICGNIVKCRWALADCEFCGEMLESLAQRHGKPEFQELLEQSRLLGRTIRNRIERLRARVWW